MKKMKILTLLLCASLAFAYMGCSNSSGGSDSGTSTPSGNNGNGTPGGAGGNGGGNSNSTPYTKVSTQTIGETTYDIVTFGTFPQSEKTDDTINVNESESKTVGSFTYYKGSDGEWYAKLNSKYYKVEPIKWRVLTADYNGTGKKLLLAENILINCKYYDFYNVNRTNGTATIYPNNYESSRIRAFLNGLSYQKKTSNSAQETDESFVNKGFFQTAFTTQEQSAIASTTVVNNAESTVPDAIEESNLNLDFNGGFNQNASDITTSDKIFLLSEQEVTKDDYGFAAYNVYGTGNTRIRMTTAFAEANGASQNSTTGYGGSWWLRSPFYNDSNSAHNVDIAGYAKYNLSVYSNNVGVVPALCLN